MEAFLSFQFIAPLVAGLFSLVMGAAVLRVEPKNVTYRYYFGIMLAIAVWSVFVAIFHIPEVTHNAWTILHWVAGLFIAPIYLLFLINFPSPNNKITLPIQFVIWGGTGAMATALLLWPENFVQYTVVAIDYIPQLTVGPYVWMLELYFPLYFVPGYLFAGRKFFRSIGAMRTHMLTGLVGLAIATTGALITNVTLAVHAGKEFIWLGPIFAAIAPASIAYMLFGMRGGKPRLFPSVALTLIVLIALGYLTVTSERIEDVILHGIVLVGVILLSIILIRTSLIERADTRRFQDISRRLQQANEGLKRADRVKSEFLNIVSHHLRTPLTHIKWALSELAEGNYGKKLDPEQQKLTKDLLANNERLVRYIETIMDTSRIETGKIVLEKEPIAIIDMLNELVESLRDRAHNYYRVEIESLPAVEDIPYILGDKESIRKVFENILENALIYNRPGGKIYIKIEKEGKNVQVEISDTGMGIVQEELIRVGEKFFRSVRAKSHAAEGTGLGVFIAKHVIGLHGGKFEIHSKAQEGTTVQITLPIFQK